MNLCMIIGNLTADPETRSTRDGKQVCNFTVAVNRRGGDSQEADFFRVSAWRALADTCGRYLSKGRKVCVTGEVHCSAYTDKAGNARGALEIIARDVEFLSPKGDSSPAPVNAPAPDNAGFIPVEDEPLPF